MSSPDDRERDWWRSPPDGERFALDEPVDDGGFDDPPQPRHARTAFIGIGLVALIGLATSLILTHRDQQPIAGHGAPATRSSAATSGGGSAWTTLSNPASGLSYQIPTPDWTVQQEVGNAGGVTLSQGARRSAYNCGNPVRPYLRGLLGSGAAVSADPSAMATALADQVATQLYTPALGIAPAVTASAAQPVGRRAPSGAMVTGAQARALATQSADPCLASDGEVIVLVLRLADHDAVFVVNGDLAGGPSSPGPATERELQAIVDSVAPTSG